MSEQILTVYIFRLKLKKYIMKKIFLLLSLLCISSCAIEKVKKNIVIDRDIEDVKKISQKALTKTGFYDNYHTYSDFYKVNISFEKNFDDSSTIIISSRHPLINDILKTSILQEYAMENGTVIETPEYRKIHTVPYIFLSLINSGLGLAYMSNYLMNDDSLYVVIPSCILVGAVDTVPYYILYKSVQYNNYYGFIVGIWLAVSFKAGFLIPPYIFKMYDFNLHNDLVDSGYNFDKNYQYEIKIKVYEF